MELKKATKDMLSMLPSWMEMRKEDSLGAQFLNVVGREIDHLEDYINDELSNAHIGTANIASIDILYKGFISLEVLNLDSLRIMGFSEDENGNTRTFEIKESSSVYDFYEGENAHKVIIDAEKRLYYLRQKYDYITIQGTMHYDMVVHHVWNCFDELGLLVGCSRAFGEKNIQYKQRILDVFKKPGSSTKDDLVNVLSRELGVSRDEISVNALCDNAFKGSLLNEDGSPTERLVKYAEKVNEAMSVTWGSALWDRGYWATLNNDNFGLDYLPHVWDASISGWTGDDFQSGIGMGDDLHVKAPSKESDTQDFEYHVGLSGIKYDQKEIYPSHSLKFKVLAEGTVVSDNMVPEEYCYTIVASPRIPLNFRIQGRKDFEQKPITSFSGTVKNFSEYNSLTEEEQRNSYIVSDENKIEIVSGGSIPNPAQRYIEIKVELGSNEDNTLSPQIDDITLSWKASGGIEKTVTIGTLGGESQEGNNYTVGFTSNTWDDESFVMRVDNEDVNMNFTAQGSMTLGYGEYYKIIDTAGDWNKYETTTNIITTEDGDLRLSI